MPISYTYYLDDIDITSEIQATPIELLEERKLTGSDNLVIATYNLVLLSDYNIFKQKSPFYNNGDNLRSHIIKSTWDNGDRFTGYVENIYQKSDKTVELSVQPAITKYMGRSIGLYVDDDKTPAKTLSDLLEWMGLQDYIDYASFNAADNIQDYNSLYCSLTINGDDTITLNDICNQIADLTCADIYLGSDGKIYYIQYTNQRFMNPANQIYESQILNYEISRSFDIINKYTFSALGVSYTSENSFSQNSIQIHGEKKKDLNYDTSQAVRPTSLSGMQWGAQQWVFRNENSKWYIKLSCMDLGFYPTLKESFLVENIPNISFEIISVRENSLTNQTDLIGMSV